jgi:acyl dehydratase
MEYYEDLAVGDTTQCGEYDVTRDEIMTFATQYDPQPIHTDPEASSIFDGLIASGWHTAAMTMRLLVDYRLADAAVAGGLGVDSLRWPEPVRPGDTLSVRTEVVELEPHDDRHGRVGLDVTTTSQRGTVLSMVAQILWKRRA